MPYRLAAGVSWRCWHDGCVVFSAATAQTLLLSPEFLPALTAADGAPSASDEIDETLFVRLAELGILEPSA